MLSKKKTQKKSFEIFTFLWPDPLVRVNLNNKKPLALGEVTAQTMHSQKRIATDNQSVLLEAHQTNVANNK